MRCNQNELLLPNKNLTCVALYGGGQGICIDNKCTTDSDCAFPGYICTTDPSFGKGCFPSPNVGPNGFGKFCTTPVKQHGCKEGLVCLGTASGTTDGFCSQRCSITIDNCPSYKDTNGRDYPSTCIKISAQDNICLLYCNNPSKACPSHMNCTTTSVGDICIPK